MALVGRALCPARDDSCLMMMMMTYVRLWLSRRVRFGSLPYKLVPYKWYVDRPGSARVKITMLHV